MPDRTIMPVKTGTTGGGSFADIRNLIGNPSVTGNEQWQNPALIKQLQDKGLLTQSTTGDASTGDTPSSTWNLDIAGLKSSGLIPETQADPFGIGTSSKWGGYRAASDPAAGGDTKYANPDMVWQDPNFGWTTFQNNRIEPKDKGFLGALPTIGKFATLAALGYGAGSVASGVLGVPGWAGNLIGKGLVGEVTGSGSPLQSLLSLISGGNKGTGSTNTMQPNQLQQILALLQQQGGGR